MYSIYNEGKSVVVERLVKTLKNKIYKHMRALSIELHSKNVYFDILDDIVDECNNMYHKTIKMKAIDVKFDSYAEYNEDSNEKDPKFKFGESIKTFLLNDMLLIDQVKLRFHFHGLVIGNVINYLNGEEIIGTFYDKWEMERI